VVISGKTAAVAAAAPPYDIVKNGRNKYVKVILVRKG